MKIQLCTITGVDNTVSSLQLAHLSVKYPFVEWAVSYDLRYSGQARFPSLGWINSFNEMCPNSHKAIHLSGDGLSSFVSAHPSTLNLIEFFARVQINLDRPSDKTPETISKLAKRMGSISGKQFIFGTNEDTIPFLPSFADIPIAILFDSSGGTGTRPVRWPLPLEGYKCGYAGGINPENIDEILEALEKLLPPDQKIWIDMQSGVRSSQNTFDVHKAENILKRVTSWAL